MWKELLGLGKQVFALFEKSQQHESDVKQLREDVKRLNERVDRLTDTLQTLALQVKPPPGD
jgi:phage shock protein A